MQLLAWDRMVPNLHPVMPTRLTDVRFKSREVGDQKPDRLRCTVHRRHEAPPSDELSQMPIKSDLAQHGQRQPVVSVSAN